MFLQVQAKWHCCHFVLARLASAAFSVAARGTAGRAAFLPSQRCRVFDIAYCVTLLPAWHFCQWCAPVPLASLQCVALLRCRHSCHVNIAACLTALPVRQCGLHVNLAAESAIALARGAFECGRTKKSTTRTYGSRATRNSNQRHGNFFSDTIAVNSMPTMKAPAAREV